MAVPTVATVGVNAITGTTANLIGAFNPNGSATTARFLVGTTTTFDPVNLAPNPSFEYDTVGSTPASWVTTGSFLTTGATITASTASIFQGARAMRIVTTGSVNQGTRCDTIVAPTGGFVAGASYTFSAWLKGASGGENIQAIFGSGSDKVQATDWNLTTSWTRHSLTWQPATNKVSAFTVIRSGTGTNYTFFVDDVMVASGANAGTYADGDSPGYLWVGTPGNSGSRRGVSSGSVGSGTVPVTVTAELFGLTPGATYYFSAVGQNASGTTTSWTNSFVATSPATTTADPVIELGTPSVTIPHFDFPFTLAVDLLEAAEVATGDEEPNEVEGYAHVVEQGSLDEVAACVKAVFACPQGACLQLPTFGVRSLLFSQMPPAAADLLSQVQQWEPRATLAIASHVLDDQSTWAVDVTVSSASDPSN